VSAAAGWRVLRRPASSTEPGDVTKPLAAGTVAV
jgi:hypothetical protein